MADLTRLEQFLNHIAHPEDPIPPPRTREEYILAEIAENKGGGEPSGGGDLEQIKTDGGVGWYEYEEVIPTLTIHPSDWVDDGYDQWAYPYPSMPEFVSDEKYRFTVNGQTTIVTALSDEWVDDKDGAEDWVIGAWFDNSPDAPDSDIELNKFIYPISERPTEDFTIRLEKVTTHTIAPDFIPKPLFITWDWEADPSGETADTTWQEVFDALAAGSLVFFRQFSPTSDAYARVWLCVGTESVGNNYFAQFITSRMGSVGAAPITFTLAATSPDAPLKSTD